MPSTAIAIIHRDEIIEQVSHGRMLRSIAKSLGIAAPSISKQLSDDPEYRQAREIGAELRLELAYLRMDECAEGEVVEEDGERIRIETKGNLARAREAAFKAAAWFAEREFPARWGSKQQVSVTTLDLNAVLAAMSEGESVVGNVVTSPQTDDNNE